MRALKILVVVMGILIILGVVIVVGTIVKRIAEKTGGEAAVTVTAPAFGDLSITLPEGARVVSVTADSGRLFVHSENATGDASVLVLDGTNGTRLGLIRFGAAR